MEKRKVPTEQESADIFQQGASDDIDSIVNDMLDK